MDNPTTTLTVDLEEVDALYVAIADSLNKIGFLAELTVEQHMKQFRLPSLEAAKEHKAEADETGRHLYEKYQGLIESIQEARRELIPLQEAVDGNKIVGLDKKPLN